MRTLVLNAFRQRNVKCGLGITLGSLLTFTANAQESNLKCMEGIYVLEEFKRDGEVFRPPQVSGRYVILNGAVL